ncbi:hypothetical protein KIN20_023334 [Parelaphostrongylus tenuis]|uniref:Reverse transcriptase domain-containing protein n=1 Tax=Parelaphostrongylus tenuis TaxID=148309 RepID=A0AAD5QXB4_PARTN|nr:hypothetical protein KIN20_023334 [Parelaphostrongylus tenuis]
MFLDRLRNANPNKYVMESFDVTALYTSLSNDFAMQATHELLIQHQGAVNIFFPNLKEEEWNRIRSEFIRIKHQTNALRKKQRKTLLRNAVAGVKTFQSDATNRNTKKSPSEATTIMKPLERFPSCAISKNLFFCPLPMYVLRAS